MERDNQEDIVNEFAEFKKNGGKLKDTFTSVNPVTNDIKLLMVIEKIKAIEEQNDQSVSFVLHGDGSGTFEDFWSEEPIIEFKSLDELMSVLITRS